MRQSVVHPPGRFVSGHVEPPGTAGQPRCRRSRTWGRLETNVPRLTVLLSSLSCSAAQLLGCTVVAAYCRNSQASSRRFGKRLPSGTIRLDVAPALIAAEMAVHRLCGCAKRSTGSRGFSLLQQIFEQMGSTNTSPLDVD